MKLGLQQYAVVQSPLSRLTVVCSVGYFQANITNPGVPRVNAANRIFRGGRGGVTQLSSRQAADKKSVGPRAIWPYPTWIISHINIFDEKFKTAAAAPRWSRGIMRQQRQVTTRVTGALVELL